MASRIHTHQKVTREQTPNLSTAPAQSMFQSRPFAVQSQKTETSQEQPDLKTALMRAERYGHHISKKQPASDSAPIKKVVQTVMTGESGSTSVIQMRGRRGSLPPQNADHLTREQLTRQQFIREFTSQQADLADAHISERGESFIPRVGFHVTPTRNAQSILQTGLDPNRGGRGGASEALGEQQFINNSQGRIHYSDRPSTSGFYNSFLEQSLGNDQATILGTRHRRGDALERDPDDPRRAFRTSELVPPSDITDLNQNLKGEFSNQDYEL